MATDLERLVVSLEANVRKFEREMARSRGVTETAMRDVERSISASTGRVEAQMGRFGTSVRAGIAGALAGISVGKLAELVDANTKVQNSLKVSGLEGAALKKTYDELFDSAQKNGAPLEALSTLYSRLSLAQKSLNVSTPELIKFTDGIALALRVSGQSAAESSGALLQLSQALSGGKIQMEEFGSLIDGAQPVLIAVAAGLKEAGGDVGKLTELVKKGEVSSEAFFRAFEAGRPVLDEMAKNTTPTLGQNFQRVENTLSRVVGELDRVSEATQYVKKAFDALIAVLDSLPKVFEQDLKDLAKIADLAKSVAESVRVAAGTIAVLRNQPLPQDSDDPPPLAFRVRPRAPNRTIEGGAAGKVDPISKDQFKPKGDKDKKGGGGSKERENELQRETAAIVKRTGALESELTTVGKSAAVIAEAEAKFKLLEAAKKANIAVGPALAADIEKTAKAYGAATEALEKAEEAQRRAIDTQRYLGQAGVDALGDLVIEGRSAADVFDNLTKSLAKAALQAALLGSGPLASVFGSPASPGGAGGGILGSLLGSITGKADGGAIKGPGTSKSDSILARLSNGEFVMNAKAAKAYGPLLEALNKGGLPGYASGGWVGSPGAEVGAEASFGRVLSR